MHRQIKKKLHSKYDHSTLPPLTTCLPVKLHNKLMEFQKSGIQFALKKRGRCLIADEMGLGKTLQAISVAYCYKEHWPLLIIVPTSLRYSWIEELEKWLPEMHPYDINLVQSGTDVSGIANSKVTLVTYGQIRHPACAVLKEALIQQDFKVIIVDESHYIKNKKAASTKYIVPLLQKAEHRILLTGTPALGRPEELFPQLNALSPEDFGNWTAFAKRYCDAKWQWFGRQKRWRTDGASNLEELHRLVAKVMIRRLKKDVLTQLPPKRRQRITFELKDSAFKKEMDRTWTEMNKVMRSANMNLLNTLSSNESQENSPTIFEVRKLIGELYRQTCKAKIGPVKEYIKMQCANEGVKLLVFAYHHDMMNGIQEQLWDDGVKFIRIDGTVAPSDRARLVNQFQKDADTRVAVLSIKAAGVGLTFTAATLVVFAELHWTPGELEQCEDRAHRIGQKCTVHVHYLVAKGTLDEWVWSALSRKTTVVTTTLNGLTEQLNMAAGSEESSHMLSNAEAWTPSTNSSHNVLQYFQTQQPRDQRSIKDFFGSGATPHRKRKRSTSGNRRAKQRALGDDETDNVNQSDDLFSSDSEVRTEETPGEQSEKPSVSSNEVINLSSDDEDFVSSPSFTKHRKTLTKAGKDSLQFSQSSKKKTPKQNIKSQPKATDMFRKTPSSQSSPFSWSKKRVDASPIHLSETKSIFSTPKSSQRKEAAGSDGKPSWSCCMCTYLNHEHINYCEMCETPKKSRKNCKSPNKGSLNIISESGVSISRENKADESIDQMSNSTLTFDENAESSELTTSDSTILTTDNTESDDIVYKISETSQSSVDLTDRPESSDLFSNADSDVTIEENKSYIEDIDSDVTEDYSLTDDISQKNPVTRDDNLTNDTGQINPDSESKHVLSTSEPLTTSAQNVLSGDSQIWFCPDCKYENESNDDFCQQCLMAKPKDSSKITEEVTQSSALLSGKDRQNHLDGTEWECVKCGYANCQEDSDCDECFTKRPDVQISKTKNDESKDKSESHMINLDDIPVYEHFQYCVSRNTERVFLYDKDGVALGVNFLPLDVEMGNIEELPDLLFHPKNLRLVQRFVREWNSLSGTKKSVIVRTGGLFVSPCMTYENLKSGRKTSTQRYTTKNDVALASLSKAEEIGGSVRLVGGENTRRGSAVTPKSAESRIRNAKVAEVVNESIKQKLKGTFQALDKEGTPLCLLCQKPCVDKALKNTTGIKFCSPACKEEYWVKMHRDYSKKKVYETEHGVCQMCGLDANQLYNRIKLTKDLKKRAELIQDSVYKSLKSEIKETMVKQPVQGLFWQVDHIQAVMQGGGQCDVDNLRTLCTVCHRGVTAEQLKQKGQQKRLAAAASCANITMFFKPH